MAIFINPWDISPYFFLKESDESKTVDTEQPDADLLIEMPSGTYHITVCLEIGAGTAIKCDLTATTLLFNPFFMCWKKDSVSGNLVMEKTTMSVANIAASSVFYWVGYVYVPNDGGLDFRWARNSASGTSTVKQGSWMHAIRI